MATTPAQVQMDLADKQNMHQRELQSPRLTVMSEVALSVLRGRAPIAPQPMMSRAGIRAEARRVRSIMRAHMKDNQLIGGT